MTEMRIHRFDFGALRDFRGPIIVKSMPEPVFEEAPPPPPPPTFSESELEAAKMAGRKQGYAEGFSAGQLDAKKAADIKSEEATQIIHQMGQLLGELKQTYQQLLQQESTHLSSLVLSIAKKVASDSLQANALQVINATVERCLPVLFSKPRVNIELHPEMLTSAMERIEGQLHQSGFEGEIQFRANPNLQLGDISLEWGDGQLHRSTPALWEEIEALINRVPLEITFAETQNHVTGA